MAKKGPVFKNKNKKNRDGTNCNDSNRVVAGLSPNDPIFYSRTVQKSVEHYIVKYNLKCSLLQFTQKMNFSTLLRQNKVSNEFLEAFINDINCWELVCREQKLSESFMDKHPDLIHWSNVSLYQKFSKSFIGKHADRLDMDVVINERFLIEWDELQDYIKKEVEKKEMKKDDEEVQDRFDILDL